MVIFWEYKFGNSTFGWILVLLMLCDDNSFIWEQHIILSLIERAGQCPKMTNTLIWQAIFIRYILSQSNSCRLDSEALPPFSWNNLGWLLRKFSELWDEWLQLLTLRSIVQCWWSTSNNDFMTLVTAVGPLESSFHHCWCVCGNIFMTWLTTVVILPQWGVLSCGMLFSTISQCQC